MRLLATMKAPAWVAATTLREMTSLKAGSAAVYSDGHTDSAALCSALNMPTNNCKAATHLQGGAVLRQWGWVSSDISSAIVTTYTSLKQICLPSACNGRALIHCYMNVNASAMAIMSHYQFSVKGCGEETNSEMRLTRAPLTSSPAEAALSNPANAFSTTPLLTCRTII